jgi:hypothetical protein
VNRGRRPGGGTPSGTSGKSSTRAVLVKPRSLAAQPPGTSGIPASLRKIWCSLCLRKHYRTLDAISLPATPGNPRRRPMRNSACRRVRGRRGPEEEQSGIQHEITADSLRALNLGHPAAPFPNSSRAMEPIELLLLMKKAARSAPPPQRVCPRRVCPRSVWPRSVCPRSVCPRRVCPRMRSFPS